MLMTARMRRLVCSRGNSETERTWNAGPFHRYESESEQQLEENTSASTHAVS